MNFNSRNKVKIEGGMASMTDLVFLLLIFFIIMSLMANNQTPIELPKTSENPPKDQNPVEATVIINADNTYIVTTGDPKSTKNAQTYKNIKEIKELVSQAVKKTGKKKLRIASHRDASFEAVFQVMALCQVNEWSPVIAYENE
ncbi:MAG: biopolymer transporter ExbD [Bacteroidetes bacterium]|nr:biopolymer transporter ExbD [Bacteroidota bacterium]